MRSAACDISCNTILHSLAIEALSSIHSPSLLCRSCAHSIEQFVSSQIFFVIVLYLGLQYIKVWLFGRVAYEVVLLPFPHPTLATTDVIGTVGPFFFFGALMFNFVIQIGQIVTENEFKLRESMKVMGLRVRTT